MKMMLSILGLALLTLFSAPAQVVTVQVTTEGQDQFLPGETLPVTVRVINNSGQTLHLGVDSSWLTFNIVSEDDNSVVMQNGNPPVVGEFDLGSSQMAIKHVDLAPYFALNQPGRYQVVAIVHIKAWGMDVASPPKEFDIINGAEIWSQQFGVPMPAGVTNRPPEVRKYTLEEANYLRQQLRMYVLVSDASGSQVYKVKAIGPMVSFSRPEAQLDRVSDLHILYQSGAQSFIYAVIDPDGDIVQRQIYDYLNTRPHLAVDAVGNIVEVGGVRRVEPGEFPVTQPPAQTPVAGKQ